MSEATVCPQCGAPLDAGASECKYCGEKIATQQVVQQIQPSPIGTVLSQPAQTQVIIQQQSQPQSVYLTNINPSWPVKSKTTAGVLGILLGGIGIHHFYLGHIGKGLLYLCFCWTGIPTLVGLIQGIIYLVQSDEDFQLQNHVRVG